MAAGLSLDLPSSLEVKESTYCKKGLFTTRPLLRGTALFTRTFHTFGVSGETLEQVQSVCQNCLARVIGIGRPAVCRQCQVACYCSKRCLRAARSLHIIECNGMSEIEKLRGKETIKVERPSSWPVNYEKLWPPCHALLVARIINKAILQKRPSDSDWIDYADSANNLPPVKSKVFPQLEKYVRMLVPDRVSNEEIKQAFRVVSINAGTVTPNPTGTYVVAAYNIEYAILNHSCQPNSTIEFEDDGPILTTIEDVETGQEITISYVTREYYSNIRKLRRAKLQECFGLDCLCPMCEGETMAGSQFWRLESQKSSLITPWTKLMASHVMVQAWSALCDCDNLPYNNPRKVIKILKASLEFQKRFLDRRNVMLVLTAVTLFLNYCMIDRSRLALQVYSDLGDVGMRSFLEYTSKRDFTEVTGNLCIRLLDLNKIREFRELFRMTLLFHPLRPSPDRLCDMLQLDEEDLPADRNWLDKGVKGEYSQWFSGLGISQGFAVELLRAFGSQFAGRKPSISKLIEITQTMPFPKDIRF